MRANGIDAEILTREESAEGSPRAPQLRRERALSHLRRALAAESGDGAA